MITGIIISLIILAVMADTFRFISKCNDEQELIRMKRKADAKK